MTDKFATELSQAWETGGILFNTPDGPVYWDFDPGKLVFFAGGCTNTGIIPVVQVPYDGSLELYDHLEKLTNAAKEYYNEKEESSVD